MGRWKDFLSFNMRKLWYSFLPLLCFILLLIVLRVFFRLHVRLFIEEFLDDYILWILHWPLTLTVKAIGSSLPALIVGIIINAFYFYVFGCWIYARKNRKVKKAA